MGAGIGERRLFFIINPHAGGGKCALRWQRYQQELDAAGLDYFWQYSTGPRSAAGQVRQAVLEEGARAVVVIGGDGSLGDALNGLLDGDKLIHEDLIFTFSPAGSACDFARSAFPDGNCDLVSLLKQGRVKQIDLGRCQYHLDDGQEATSYFINSFDAGAGADTCVAVNAESGRIKRLLRNGKLAFMLSALKVLMTFDYCQTTVETDGEEFSGQYLIICAGNGAFSGGGMMLLPRARLDDGLLDVLLVEKLNRRKMLPLFARIYDGSFLRERDMVYRQCRQVTINTQRPIPIELDGEVPGCTAARISVLPGLLPFLAPDGE